MSTPWQYTDPGNLVVSRINDEGSMESRSVLDPMIVAFIAGGGVPLPSASPLEIARSAKQRALDSLFDANFDLARFIRSGTATTITATNVGNFLATITNNYRSLRASISVAVDIPALNAINVNTGWPNNP